jgi:hypothetical protein
VTEPAKKTPAKRAPRRASAEPQDISQAEDVSNEVQVGEPMSWPYPNVHELWSRVMEDVRSVAKGDFNEDQGFKFRGVDAVVNAVGPALRAHKVHIRPRRIISQTATEYTTKRGSRMVNRVVHVEWEVTGPQGDTFVGESMGEAADAGDKSLSKAQSVAYRMYLLQALAIPTGDRDPDADAHERDTPAANEGHYWDQQQEQQYGRQRPSQPRQSARQEQAGEENQAAQADVEAARAEMWKTCKALGWEWKPLSARFKADHDGRETSHATKVELEAFTAELVREAEEEEDRAKKVAAEQLGARPIEEAHTTGGVL